MQNDRVLRDNVGPPVARAKSTNEHVTLARSASEGIFEPVEIDHHSSESARLALSSIATMTNAPTQTAQQTLTVAQLTAQIKDALEGEFPSVWVTGEISNYSRPQSGHCYFTLKDDQAQIRAVMWRSSAARLKFDVADGLDIICHGHIDVYAPRGSYQLVIDELQPKGMGALELALRKLREKLAAEGLFDPRGSAYCRRSRAGWRSSPAPPARPCATFSKCCGGDGVEWTSS